ncbi:MAG: 30S ribosomal protein S17 [Deltaproteobacteria bacterium]|nr:30S ribosomal protein S17 [Deltaproteobacteria bacterium]
MDQKFENKRKSVVAKVVSSKPDKTFIAISEYRVKHPIYKKFVKRETKYVVHDYKNQARTGDEVEILESRPLSKTKRWVLKSIKRTGLNPELDGVI